jgi:hypothetical protein
VLAHRAGGPCYCRATAQRFVPIVLVIDGLVLALFPGLPEVRLEPDIVFLVFLPLSLNWFETFAAHTLFGNPGVLVSAPGFSFVPPLLKACQVACPAHCTQGRYAINAKKDARSGSST